MGSTLMEKILERLRELEREETDPVKKRAAGVVYDASKLAIEYMQKNTDAFLDNPGAETANLALGIMQVAGMVLAFSSPGPLAKELRPKLRETMIKAFDVSTGMYASIFDAVIEKSINDPEVQREFIQFMEQRGNSKHFMDLTGLAEKLRRKVGM